MIEPIEPMNAREVATLLAAIGAYDARTVGRSEIEAWLEAATRGRWTYAEAVEAVHQHFASDESGLWLMPGRVNGLIRRARQDARERAVAERLAQEKPAPERAGGGAPDGVVAAFAAAAAGSKRRSAERRTRVLAHPDLAAELARPPLALKRPETWSGWIPPRLYDGKINDAPGRAQAVAIVVEAYRRDGVALDEEF